MSQEPHIFKLFGLYDTAIGAYGFVFPADNDHVAVRLLSVMLSEDPDSLLNTHPQHFVLFELGTFDRVSGIVQPAVPPVHVSSFVDLVGGLRRSRSSTAEVETAASQQEQSV